MIAARWLGDRRPADRLRERGPLRGQIEAVHAGEEVAERDVWKQVGRRRCPSKDQNSSWKSGNEICISRGGATGPG